jgi:signal transduction histidine kinase
MVTRFLGGSIRVQSELGQGSCFTIELPLHAPEPLASVPAALPLAKA